MSLETPYYPGINYNADKGPQILGVAIAFTALSAVVLALRAFSRWYTKIAVGLDDWLIIGAAVLTWTYSAVCIVEVVDNHYGQHIGKTDAYHLSLFGKELYVLAIVYPPALTLSKLSLLALYWRIFRVTTARRPLQILAALNVAWMIAAFLVGILSCLPVKANWDSSIPKKCIDYPALFLSNEAITMVFDLAVLLMPVYFISNIQRSLTQRISISITFLLGLVATLVSALRLWRLVVADRLPVEDVTYTEADAALWAIIELNVWVLVASIPSLRPMVLKVYQESRRSTSSGSSKWSSIFSFRKDTALHTAQSGGRRRRHSSLDHTHFGHGQAGSSTTAIASAGTDLREAKPDPFPDDFDWTSNLELRELGGIRVDKSIEVHLESNMQQQRAQEAKEIP